MKVTFKNDRSNTARDGLQGLTSQTIVHNGKTLSTIVEYTGLLAEMKYISPGHPGPWKLTEYGKERMREK